MVGADEPDGLRVRNYRQWADVCVFTVAGGTGDGDFIHGEQELQGPDIPTAL